MESRVSRNIFVSDSVVAVNEAGSDELPRISEPISVGIAGISTFIISSSNIKNSVLVNFLSLVELVNAVPNEGLWARIVFAVSKRSPESSIAEWLA